MRSRLEREQPCPRVPGFRSSSRGQGLSALLVPRLLERLRTCSCTWSYLAAASNAATAATAKASLIFTCFAMRHHGARALINRSHRHRSTDWLVRSRYSPCLWFRAGVGVVAPNNQMARLLRAAPASVDQ